VIRCRASSPSRSRDDEPLLTCSPRARGRRRRASKARGGPTNTFDRRVCGKPAMIASSGPGMLQLREGRQGVVVGFFCFVPLVLRGLGSRSGSSPPGFVRRRTGASLDRHMGWSRAGPSPVLTILAALALRPVDTCWAGAFQVGAIRQSVGGGGLLPLHGWFFRFRRCSAQKRNPPPEGRTQGAFVSGHPQSVVGPTANPIGPETSSSEETVQEEFRSRTRAGIRGSPSSSPLDLRSSFLRHACSSRGPRRKKTQLPPDLGNRCRAAGRPPMPGVFNVIVTHARALAFRRQPADRVRAPAPPGGPPRKNDGIRPEARALPAKHEAQQPAAGRPDVLLSRQKRPQGSDSPQVDDRIDKRTSGRPPWAQPQGAVARDSAHARAAATGQNRFVNDGQSYRVIPQAVRARASGLNAEGQGCSTTHVRGPNGPAQSAFDQFATL